MSDQTIRKGDLVMVVRAAPCCGSTQNIGTVSKVRKIAAGNDGQCRECGGNNTSKYAVLWEDGSGEILSRLIKINPPPITQETEREVTV